jgi:DNA-binding NtrC family response regulator
MAISGLPTVEVSRGALEKMVNHDWPGNVRELRNCITRSLAFAEGELLLAEHILFDERGGVGLVDTVRGQEQAISSSVPSPRKIEAPGSDDSRQAGSDQEQQAQQELNPRQRKAWVVIARNGAISRSEYQAAVGEAISVRTAQYDLHDLVAKGLLKKTGRGPSSRYLVTQSYVV